jgi:hypothetical protein
MLGQSRNSSSENAKLVRAERVAAGRCLQAKSFDYEPLPRWMAGIGGMNFILHQVDCAAISSIFQEKER